MSAVLIERGLRPYLIGKLGAQVGKRDHLELVLHGVLSLGEMITLHREDILAHRAGGMRIFMKVKELSLHAVDRPIHIVQSDIV